MVKVIFSGNDISLIFFQSSLYSYLYTPFHNNKINLLISWSEKFCLLTDLFFEFSSSVLGTFYGNTSVCVLLNCLQQFCTSEQHSKSLYSIPDVLQFLLLCPYLPLVLSIPSARLLTRFDNGLAINLALSIHFNL